VEYRTGAFEGVDEDRGRDGLSIAAVRVVWS
jgi:hypothetical protein